MLDKLNFSDGWRGRRRRRRMSSLVCPDYTGVIALWLAALTGVFWLLWIGIALIGGLV